jgi:GTP-sensing pleiotropic transcriptional regulator CodY
LSQQDFGKFDFSANIIKEIVNTNHFVIDRKKTYHGGAIILTGNNLTKFIDFEKNRYSEYYNSGKGDVIWIYNV